MRIVKGQLPILNDKAIELAVSAFASEIAVHGDSVGFQNQTIKSIYHAVFDNSGDFWLHERDGEVMGYLICRVGIDIDDKLTYWVSQAWANPKMRGDREVREWWKKVKAYAKERLCKHIVVISGRNGQEAAYCRFLGKGFQTYAVLLKKDI